MGSIHPSLHRRGFTPAALATAAATALLLSACAPDPGTGTSGSAAAVAEVDDLSWEASDASASPTEGRDDTFVTTISEPGGVFLPYFYDNGWDGNATQPIFSSLVVSDDAGEPIPDLAESWEVSDDGLSYTYHLRDGLTFADGSPLTAEDVAFTLTLLNDPGYAAGGVDFSRIGIVGTDAYKDGSADSISGIEVVDDTTITIETEQQNPLALTTLGGQVLSKAYYGAGYQRGELDYLRDLYSKPLGDGPYQLDEYVEGQELRYDANPNYYGGEPKIPHLIFKVLSSTNTLQALQNGEIDFGGFPTDQDTISQLQDLPFVSGRTRTIPDIGLVYVNNRKPALAPTEARQALYYGLDRQQVVDAKYHGLGQVADVFAAPTQWSYTNDGVTQYEFDPEKANALLDELGWTTGSDGIRERDGERLTLSYLTSRDDDPVIPIATQNYAAIGIDFVPEVLDSNTLFDRFYAGDYDLLAVRTSGLTDPNDAVSEFASDDDEVNVAGYHNDRVSELVQEGIATSDREERQAIYAELYRELSNDPPLLLIDYRKGVSAWNARIEGAEHYSTGSSDAAIQLATLSIAAS